MSWKLAELRWRHELGLRDRKTERFQGSKARTTFSTKAHATDVSGDLFDKGSNDPHDSRQNAHPHQSLSASESEILRGFHHTSSLSTTPLLAHVQALDREPWALSTRTPATAPLPSAQRFQRSATTSGAWESRGSPIKRSVTLFKWTDRIIHRSMAPSETSGQSPKA